MIIRARARSMRSNPRGARPPPRSSRRRSRRPLTLTTAHLRSPPEGARVGTPRRCARTAVKASAAGATSSGCVRRISADSLTPHAYQLGTVLYCSAALHAFNCLPSRARTAGCSRVCVSTPGRARTRARMHVFTRVTRASCGLAACESEPARAAAPRGQAARRSAATRTNQVALLHGSLLPLSSRRMTLGFGARARRMDHFLARCHVAQIFGRARRGPAWGWARIFNTCHARPTVAVLCSQTRPASSARR